MCVVDAQYWVGRDVLCFSFMKGLKSELKGPVMSQMPSSLDKAISLAKIQERL
jgi:hypothetical protein